MTPFRTMVFAIDFLNYSVFSPKKSGDFPSYSNLSASLAADGYITMYQTEILSFFYRAKATEYFQLNFGHTNIVLTTIISECNFYYRHEAQHIILKFAQPLKQVSRFNLLDWTALADWPFLCIGWWRFNIHFRQNASVSTLVILALHGREQPSLCLYRYIYCDQ